MFHRDTPDEAEFRGEVRAWLEANLPLALRGRTARPPPAELMPWYQTLSRKRWVAPHWPKQYGGMGATLNQQRPSISRPSSSVRKSNRGAWSYSASSPA